MEPFVSLHSTFIDSHHKQIIHITKEVKPKMFLFFFIFTYDGSVYQFISPIFGI